MKRIDVPYGTSTLAFRRPSNVSVDVVRSTLPPAPLDQRAAVEAALSHPIGGVSLDQFKREGRLVIVVSDKTRPVPLDVILPSLEQRLTGWMGVARAPVTWVVATGAHHALTSDELEELIPQWVLDKHQVVSHNARDPCSLKWVGSTSRGTPLWINRHYLEADIRILVGNVGPHQLAGFSGGAKSVVIGLGGLDTIEANHAMMNHPRARMGVGQGNPIREDIDEGGRLIGADFVINTVVNSRHQIVRTFAGSLEAVSRDSRSFCLKMAQLEHKELADVVVASAGGYPGDINLYQAQKALASACQVVRPGGTVILVAECSEGIGDELFQRWMMDAASPSEVIDRFRHKGFRLGAHKAYLFARDMVRAKVFLVSTLSDVRVKKFFLVPFHTLQDALEAALSDQPQGARVTVLPDAPHVVPVPRAARRSYST